jgi:uncharacterized protein (DUF1501 family)
VLTFLDSFGRQGRREFLRVGSLALGGLSLPGLLAAKASGAAAALHPVTDKSVVFLFMHGGPSQFETFDPKMNAPAEIRSATGEISTALPGVTIGSTYTKLAQMANRFSIVRSYTPGDAKHDIKPIINNVTNKASLGAIYSRVAGATHPRTGMPTNAALYPPAVEPNSKPTTLKFGDFGSTGLLGSGCAPFAPGSGGQLQESMRLNLPKERLYDRRTLLGHLDRIHRNIDVGGTLTGMDKFQEQAFQTILGGVADAFDLSKEDPRVVARYDTSQLSRPENISRKWNNYQNYVDHGASLGKLMLLARRLCEGGCGFVTVTTNFVWDNHADNNNCGVEEGMRYCGLPFDHAVSTFLEDVHARGLSDKILLVCCGEIGRTPRINARGGRDHWGNLGPLLLSGGGLKSGKVIGQSTRDGGEAMTEPMTPSHLTSTIMNTLFDVTQLRLVPGLPTELIRTITESAPIPGLA